ncbi:MAG: hypothetical protein WAK50_16140 [Nitrososphaeraceae archaeon]|jgi:hypothetical protein
MRTQVKYGFLRLARKKQGYITLAMSQLSKDQHVKLKAMTSHSHLPALLLGQMARDIDYEGRGLGRLMKDWAISQALRFSVDIGCRLVILDSEEDKVNMYKRWEFLLTKPKKNKFIISY